MATNVEVIQHWLADNQIGIVRDAACSACWVRCYNLSGLLMPLEDFEVAMLSMGLAPRKVHSGLWSVNLPARHGGAQVIQFPTPTKH